MKLHGYAAGLLASGRKSAGQIPDSAGLFPANLFCLVLAFFSRQTANKQYLSDKKTRIKYAYQGALTSAKILNPIVLMAAIQMIALFARETLFGKTRRASTGYFLSFCEKRSSP
jgi:hypothetical protein